MKINNYFKLIILVFFFSCSPVSGPDKSISGAILGAGWGAGTGAIIGTQVGGAGAGTAIGSGVGLVGGALTGIGLDIIEGSQIDRREELEMLSSEVQYNEDILIELRDSLDNWEKELSNFVNINSIYFDKNRASLKLGSVTQLEKLADFIKMNSLIKFVEIHGYANDTTDLNLNDKLSEARAKSVKTFLAFHGIREAKLKIVSHGGKSPVIANESKSAEKLNQRVDIFLIR